ncbi:MAG: hypothetical protein KDN22_28190 [Verrucomicrobiae bacterium]|nr:hypothetical protein [Verrucomicrobiae bacterium]
MMMPRLVRTIAILCTLTLAAIACQVPVFRFALERWEADDYRIVIYEKGPRSEATASLIERLQQASRHSTETTAGHANLAIELADIENLTDAQQWSLLDWDSIASFPAMQVYYPESTGIEAPLWQGDFSSEAVDQLLNSPARKEITERLTAGDSAVWLLLESGDITADALAEEKLKQALATAESTLEIPEGVIRPEQLAGTINTRDTPVEMDDVLRSRIPLKIAFSVMHIDPGDPAEAIFVRMLTQSDPANTQQRAIPVFGRGRMMPGIPVTQFTDSAIGTATGYLCGACSCQVKEQNPGLDLLIDTDWSKHLQDGLIVTERELPPLTGAGDLLGASETPAPVEISIETVAEQKPFGLTPLLVTLGSVVLVIVVGSFVMLRR